jgi:uncharacterized protein (TIGR04222 family)
LEARVAVGEAAAGAVAAVAVVVAAGDRQEPASPHDASRSPHGDLWHLAEARPWIGLFIARSRTLTAAHFFGGNIAMIALVILAVVYGRVRSHDKTGLGALPPDQSAFNPYELADLRGGKNEVIRTVVYVLNQRGLVEILRPKWRPVALLVERAAGRGAEELTELEVRVLQSLHCSNMPVEARELLHRETLGSDIETLCGRFRDKLQSDQLLRSDDAGRPVSRIWFLASSLGIALLLYAVLIATNKGLRDIKVLFLLVILTIFWLALWGRGVRSVTDPRISRRGRAYIKRLQMAYAGELAAFPIADRRHGVASVMLIGLFGPEILAGTSDAIFARVFAKEPWGSGGGAGSGGSGGGCG